MSDRLFDPDDFGDDPTQAETPAETTAGGAAVEIEAEVAPLPPPPDLDDRERILGDLDRTLFVEAGAGSGKTTSLVGRIIELLTGEPAVPLHAIAAITFTEKAAAELRDRVRTTLEQRLAAISTSDPRADIYATALDDLDGSAISTLHAFAQRLLSEFPVEAGLPPSIDVLDEISSQVAFDERWRDFLDHLLDDTSQERTLLTAFAVGVKIQHLRELAVAFNNNWDLLAERVDDEDEPRPLPVQSVIEQIDALVARRAECSDPDDKLHDLLTTVESFGAHLGRADTYARLEMIGNPKAHGLGARKVGKKGNWHDIESIRVDYHALLDRLDALHGTVADQVIKRIAMAVRDFTLEAATTRRRAGRLEFHDLLVGARDLLRNPVHGETVTASLRDRYRRLLLDEFQDTDPIQIELATLLATDPTTRPDSAEWDRLAPDPGRLFFVGDPKQSIYRFRRADIGLFLRARDRFGDPTVRLSANFRTTAPIIDWVNEVFGRLIQHQPGSQAEYEALQPIRSPAPKGPGVAIVGGQAHDDAPSAAELREREAADIAGAIGAALSEGWQVQDPESGEWREPRLGDITILIPARTSLGALEAALDARAIPHRAETSSLVWSTREIRDLVMALTAADDPTDELAITAALRSSIYGCGDDDLYRFAIEHRGSWDHQVALPESLPPDDPVAIAMSHLAELHRRRTWHSPSELIEQVIRERMLMEQAAARQRPRDVWRRLRFVQDQARAYGDAENGSLRQFLHWAALQSAEGARVTETVLPETDDDSVRIMTIHGSKGLEFPITLVSGLSTIPSPTPRGVHVAFPADDGPAVIKLGKNLETTEYQEYVPVDEQMGHDERVRLLYVACTRARDHLVVSTHRKSRPNPPDTRPDNRLTNAELVFRASETITTGHLDESRFVERPDLRSEPPPTPDLPTPSAWRTQREAALVTGNRPRTLSATAIANDHFGTGGGPGAIDEDTRTDPGLAKQPRDLGLPPWMKGRYGTAIGRAVHAVLQTIDLRTGDGLAAAARAQAAAEGVLGTEATIEALVRSALDADLIAEAAGQRFWRETYVATVVDGATIEGYVDLLYEDPTSGHLVVVDHKTDFIPDDEALAEKVRRYRLQAATYALAVEAATGRRVGRAVLLFLDPGGARAAEIDDLDDATTEVRARITATVAQA